MRWRFRCPLAGWCVYQLNTIQHMETIHWQLITYLRLHTHAHTHNLISLYTLILSLSHSLTLYFSLYYHADIGIGHVVKALYTNIYNFIAMRVEQ